MLNEQARQIVHGIQERIRKSQLINLAQLPTENDPTGHLALERVLSESVRELHPDLCLRIRSEYFGEGPLGPLLNDPSITEIIVNGEAGISYEQHGLLRHWPDHFLSDITYRNFLVRLFRESEIQITLEHPFANGRWRGFRVHVSGPPVVPDRPVLVLRRLAKTPWTFERLASEGWAPRTALQIIQQMIEEKQNVLVVGSTGSGKTSVVNAYLQTLADNKRVITLEDVSELIQPNRVSTQLLTRHDPQEVLREVQLTDLVRQSLRMRPDHLVLGEVRGPEAKDLLMAWSTGHAGSWATLHAQNARQALLRLEMLVQLGAPQWNLQAVRLLIQLGLQAVLVVGRKPCGKRALLSIDRLTSLEEHGFLLDQVWSGL